MKKAPDAFRTIGEVADLLETPAHVLRFWESKFYQIKPVKRAGGRRYYRPDDVALIAGIRHLLQDRGMTIRGVQKMLQEEGVRHVASLAPPLPSEVATGAETDAEAGAGTGIEAGAGLSGLPAAASRPGAAGVDHASPASPAPDQPAAAPEAPGRVPQDPPLTVPPRPTPPSPPPVVPPPAAPASPGWAMDRPRRADPAAPPPHEAPGRDSRPPTVAPAMGDAPTRPAAGEGGAPTALPPERIEIPPRNAPGLASEVAARSTPGAEAAGAPEPDAPQPGPRPAQILRDMPRGRLGARTDRLAILATRIDRLLDRMSEASGSGRW